MSSVERTAERIVEEVERFIEDAARSSPTLRNIDSGRLVAEVADMIRNEILREDLGDRP